LDNIVISNTAPGITGVLWLDDSTNYPSYIGSTGVSGLSGATGATGASGLSGTTGATGASGLSGTTGATGASGLSGTTGATGASGIQGFIGTTGATGASGLSGTTGATGASGLSGATGASGVNGSNGATGASGVNGSNGATGASGFTGATGSAINAVTGTGVAGWIPYWNSTSTIASSSGQSVYIGTVTTTSSSLQPFIVKGVASQSANLFEVQDSTSAVIHSISSSGAMNMFDNELIRPRIRDYSETVSSPAIVSGVLTVNLETSNIFTVALNANITTFTVSNPPADGYGGSFTIIFTADGTQRTITWGSAIKWANGVAPTMSSAPARKDVVSFFTSDGGTIWLAFISGQNFFY
jgi:hypothetical protein